MSRIAGRFTAGLVGPRAVCGPVRPEWSPVGRAAARLRNTPVSRPTEPLMSDQPALVDRARQPLEPAAADGPPAYGAKSREAADQLAAMQRPAVA